MQTIANDKFFLARTSADQRGLFIFSQHHQKSRPLLLKTEGLRSLRKSARISLQARP